MVVNALRVTIDTREQLQNNYRTTTGGNILYITESTFIYKLIQVTHVIANARVCGGDGGQAIAPTQYSYNRTLVRANAPAEINEIVLKVNRIAI